jgi:hypothetical protein
MPLEGYATCFRQLNVNRRRGHASPHKVCMLLAVMDLIEAGEITVNRIEFGDALVQKFRHHFEMLQSGSDQLSPHLPFYHLKSDGFWHHKVREGQRAAYQDLNRSTSQRRLRESIDYAYLDEELFQFLNYATTREVLKYALFENVDLAARQDLRGAIGDWSVLECELIVADYLDMLLREMRGEAYSKAEHRRALRQHLRNRTEGSIEYKHQNISAILIDLGLPYIRGYKPAFNYQGLLRDVVVGCVDTRTSQIEAGADAAILSEPESVLLADWSAVIDTPPELIRDTESNQIREFTPRFYNYAEREEGNRRLGLRGEEFVLNYERYRLTALGRPDLAEDIEWTSKERGDGAGFDLRSFHGDRDEELYIEVKTTNSGKYQPFLISDNEVAFSEEHARQYSLYRVFEFKQSARIFTLSGSIREDVKLAARQYQASFR